MRGQTCAQSRMSPTRSRERPIPWNFKQKVSRAGRKYLRRGEQKELSIPVHDSKFSALEPAAFQNRVVFFRHIGRNIIWLLFRLGSLVRLQNKTNDRHGLRAGR